MCAAPIGACPEVDAALATPEQPKTRPRRVIAHSARRRAAVRRRDAALAAQVTEIDQSTATGVIAHSVKCAAPSIMHGELGAAPAMPGATQDTAGRIVADSMSKSAAPLAAVAEHKGVAPAP
jgi:hypothetical protein